LVLGIRPGFGIDRKRHIQQRLDGPDRGHGHGIYVQNATDPRKIIDNIIFNQFSHGVHGYTEGGLLNQLYLEGISPSITAILKVRLREIS